MSADTDLRTSYAASIARTLSSTLPFPTSNRRVGFPTAGLDCLLCVIRRCYSVEVALGNILVDQSYRSEEELNPILSFAWQDFNLSGDEDATEHRKNQMAWEKRTAIEKIIEGHEFPDDLPFSSLAESNIMDNTLWARLQFRAFSPVYEFIGHSPELTIVKMKEPDTTKLAPTSLLHLDCRGDPSTSLESFIDRHFGVRPVPPSSIEIWPSREPTFLRLQYRANADMPMPPQRLRTFNMPIGQLSEPSAGNFYFNHIGRVTRYALVAAVRQRQTDAELDYVRLYRENGAYIQPEYETEIVQNEWSLGDQGGRCYTLLYVRSPDVEFDPGCPEVTVPRAFDGTLLGTDSRTGVQTFAGPAYARAAPPRGGHSQHQAAPREPNNYGARNQDDGFPGRHADQLPRNRDSVTGAIDSHRRRGQWSRGGHGSRRNRRSSSGRPSGQ